MQGYAGYLLLLLAAGLFAGCADLPQDAAGESPVPVQAATAEPERLPDPPLLRAYPLLLSPALQAYVEDVGRRLAQLSGRQADWRFGIIDHPGFGAYALPDGRIYLARGLLAKLNSEAELAAVLAREIAHIVDHQAPIVRDRPVLPGLLGPSPDFDLDVPYRYRPGDHNAADARAARMLVEAGYDPRALLAVMGRDDEVRKRVVELARRDGGPDYRIARNEYLQQLGGLPWGMAYGLGRLDGATLRHDAYGLALTFPKGWKIESSPGRVVAGESSGAGLIELAPVPAGEDPKTVLESLLPFDKGGRFDAGELNGRPAAFAAGTVAGHPVLASVVRFETGLFAIVAQSIDAEAYRRDRAALRATLNSLRPLAQGEHGAGRQLKLAVITLDAPTSLAALAAKAPPGVSAVQVLRLLNGLPARAELRAGQSVKILE